MLLVDPSGQRQDLIVFGAGHDLEPGPKHPKRRVGLTAVTVEEAKLLDKMEHSGLAGEETRPSPGPGHLLGRPIAQTSLLTASPPPG